MTTELERPGLQRPGLERSGRDGAAIDGVRDRNPLAADHRAVPAGSPDAGRRRNSIGDWLARHPAWPITAMLAGFPLWWAIGLADYIFVLLAIPMAARMYAWRAHRVRPVKMPPGFVLWLLFLVCMLAGVLALSLTAPGTVASPVGNRIFSFSIRAISYLALTIVLLYAGNLTERELPRRRLAWLLGLLAIYVVIGGIGGVLAPSFHFTAPLAYLVPSGAQSAMLDQAMLHPSLSQVQTVLGVAEGRPSAPFDYTNTWGNCLAILLPWLLVGWWTYGTRRQRRIAIAALAISIVPIIYSLDRGVWIALMLAVCYQAVRMAAQGKLALLGAIFAGVALLGVVIVATPLQGLISSRLQHEQSNTVRASLSVTATQDALASPLIGFGDTRHQQGSVNSIAIGPSAKCAECGQVSVGSTGQLWLLFVCNGIVGAGLYLGFFGYGIWRYRRDKTPYGLAGVLVLLLGFVFMFAYDAVGAPLLFTMLAYAMLWKNDMARGQQADGLEADGQLAITRNR